MTTREQHARNLLRVARLKVLRALADLRQREADLLRELAEAEQEFFDKYGREPR